MSTKRIRTGKEPDSDTNEARMAGNQDGDFDADIRIKIPPDGARERPDYPTDTCVTCGGSLCEGSCVPTCDCPSGMRTCAFTCPVTCLTCGC
jgi:hypothetical protein